MNPYEVESHVPEVYDQEETKTHDVKFIKKLLQNTNCSRILEPFCGTARILLPLAEEGYGIVGIDSSPGMLKRLREKLHKLTESVQERINIIQSDLTVSDWPNGFDAVLLAGNCLYELADVSEQQEIVKKAADSLKPEGFLFVDNDNMEGELADSWCHIDREVESFPSGLCRDGTQLQGYMRTTWIDRKTRIWRAQRRLEITYQNGRKEERRWHTQKHPVSADGVSSWMQANDLKILRIFGGTKDGRKFKKASKRATFWAQKGQCHPGSPKTQIDLCRDLA